MKADAPLNAAVIAALLKIDLTTEMHHRGIGMRHLGALRAMFWHKLHATATPITQKRRVEFSSDPTLDLERGGVIRCGDEDQFVISANPDDEFSTKAVTLTKRFPRASVRNMTVWTGKVTDCTNSREVRAFLLAEMVARTLKNLLRRYQRAITQRVEANVALVHESILLHVLNSMSGSHVRSEQFWNTELLPALTLRFGDRAVSYGERFNLRAQVRPLLPYVLKRLCSMLHIVLNADVRAPALPSVGYNPDDDVEVAADGANVAAEGAAQKRRVGRVARRTLAESKAKVRAARAGKDPSTAGKGARGGAMARGAGPHRLPLLLRKPGTSVVEAKTSSALERFEAQPEGFVFTHADVADCDARPRVKHNMVLLEYAQAALVSAYARAENQLTYPDYVLKDDPVAYWRLNERQLSRRAKSLGRLNRPARIPKAVEIEVRLKPGEGLANEPEDGNRVMRFHPKAKGSLAVPYAVQLVPLNPTQGFSVEMWARCDGGDGHVRVGMKSGRYMLGLMKSREWCFSVYCGDVDVEVTVTGPRATFGKWTYVVGTYDGTLMRLYVDAQLVAACDLYKEANAKTSADDDSNKDGLKKVAEQERARLEQTKKDVKQAFKAYCVTPKGSARIRREAKRIKDKSDIRARLSTARQAAHFVGFKAVALEEATVQVKEQIHQEMLDEAVAKVHAEFEFRRDQMVKDVAYAKQGGSETARTPLYIGAGPVTGRHKYGNNFWHGLLCHVAVYSVGMHRDRIAGHYRRGLVSTDLEAQRLFGLANDRFRAALLDDPENHVVLTKYARSLCQSVRDEMRLTDHTHKDTIRFHALIREAATHFMRRRNVAGLCTLLEHMPALAACGDLACDVYDALCAVEPLLATGVDVRYNDRAYFMGGGVELDGSSEVSRESLLKAAEADAKAEGRSEPVDAAEAQAERYRDMRDMASNQDAKGQEGALNLTIGRRGSTADGTPGNGEESKANGAPGRELLRLGTFAGYKYDRDIMSMLRFVPSRYKLPNSNDSRKLRTAARMYQAVLSRNPRAYGDVPLDWVKKLRTPGAVVAVVRVWEQELDAGVLDLTMGASMTEAEAATILSYHRSLRVLDATGCEGITDAAASELSEGLQKMQKLVLAKCPRLTDKVLQTLAYRFDRLATLDLSGCPYVIVPARVLLTRAVADRYARVVSQECV